MQTGFSNAFALVHPYLFSFVTAIAISESSIDCALQRVIHQHDV